MFIGGGGSSEDSMSVVVHAGCNIVGNILENSVSSERGFVRKEEVKLAYCGYFGRV